MIFLLIPIALCLGAGRFYFNPRQPCWCLCPQLCSWFALSPPSAASNTDRPKHPMASRQNTDIPKTAEVTLKHLLPQLQHLLSIWWPWPVHSPALGGDTTGEGHSTTW